MSRAAMGWPRRAAGGTLVALQKAIPGGATALRVRRC